MEFGHNQFPRDGRDSTPNAFATALEKATEIIPKRVLSNTKTQQTVDGRSIR